VSVSSESRPVESPRLSVADVQQLAAAQLSVGSRVGYTVLLVVSITMAAGVGSLWATEPSLPTRTHVAFACIVGMALTWSVFATWVLARRRVLLGTDRVLAAKIGLAFSAMATTGIVSVGYWGGVGRPAYVGGLVNSALCVVAAVLFVRARRRLETLSRRRRELERHLGSSQIGV
jgi:hypothetical protein